MRIDEFLARLEGVQKISGGWIAKCPAHDDRKASLCVSLGSKTDGGKERIILKCMAGCDTQEVVKAMGLTMADLFDGEKKSGTRTVRPAAPSAEKPKLPSPLLVEGGAYYNVKTQKNETITAVYDYQLENGDVALKVFRTNEKSFPAMYREGKSWYWGRGGYGCLLYHLPIVMRGVMDGKPIFFVEGEKDVETMLRMGYAATTNLGGANKWQDPMCKYLLGADLILIPDNDEPGKKSVAKIAYAMKDIAKRVRVLDLKTACINLPEKGDISDFVQILGEEKAKQELEKMLSAEDEQPESYVQAFDGVDGYAVINGAICSMRGKNMRPLCNFVALPVEEVSRDDGVEISKVVVIDGWRNGEKMARLTVGMDSFESMNWVLPGWGIQANIEPGSAIKGQLRNAIQAAGMKSIKRKTVYVHTGWRKVGSKWAYLHAGGTIGAGLDVDLSGDDNVLSGYDLSGAVDGPLTKLKGKAREKAAAETSLRTMMIADFRITVPLLSFMYLAPLKEFLDAKMCAPSFIPYVCGKTGEGKTTIAALMLCHYGRKFSGRNTPASFSDTTNTVRQKAFLCKDAPLLVDDYKPSGNQMERRMMENMAQLLCRAWGDGAERGRMRSDAKMQGKKPPRGLGIETGEELPNIGESGLARLYIINIRHGDVQMNKELSEMQDAAQNGELCEAMKGYITWLSERTEGLEEKLFSQYMQLREQARAESEIIHNRMPSVVAHLMLGASMMLDYMIYAGALTEGDKAGYMQLMHDAIRENIKEQTVQMREEQPVPMFLSAVNELIQSGRCYIKDISAVTEQTVLPKDTIGYCDSAYYYLFPETAYGAVQKLLSDQGRLFPIQRGDLYRQLCDAGRAVKDEKEGRTTKNLRRAAGKVHGRFLWLKREAVDGYKASEQMTLVDDDELNPFEEGGDKK